MYERLHPMVSQQIGFLVGSFWSLLRLALPIAVHRAFADGGEQHKVGTKTWQLYVTYVTTQLLPTNKVQVFLVFFGGT